MPRRSERTLPAEPFHAWLHDRLRILQSEHAATPQEALAARLGMSSRALYRYLHLQDAQGAPTTTFEAARVMDALERYGETPWFVYPQLAPPSSPGTVKAAFCPRCTTLVVPCDDGSCVWCGTRTGGAEAPMIDCACGCGTPIRAYDKHLRPVRYVRGHAPRSLERPKPPVALEPFANWLETRLGELGSLAALAKDTGVGRGTLRQILGRVDKHGRTRRVIDRKLVQRALRKSGAQGKGRPWREGTPSFRELYPPTCMCGQPKAPHAALCRHCRDRRGRIKARRRPRDRRAELRKMDELTLREARRLYLAGASFREVARRLYHRTGYSSQASMANSLHEQFRRRGWQTRRQGDATAAANADRAFRPQCAHIHQTGSKKGQRCQKRSVGEGGYCWHHEPERIAAGIELLRSGGQTAQVITLLVGKPVERHRRSAAGGRAR